MTGGIGTGRVPRTCRGAGMGRRGAPCPGNGFSGRAGKGAGPDVPLVRAASGADPRGRDGCGDEGHHPCRRGRHAALSRHQRGEQAAPARVRQAHDLLPAERPDARGDPGRPGDRHAAARLRLPAASGRRQPVGPRAPPRRAAEPRRSGASLPDRQGVQSAATPAPWPSATTSSTGKV